MLESIFYLKPDFDSIIYTNDCIGNFTDFYGNKSIACSIEGTLIDIDNIGNYPMDQVVIITTGSQGEPMSALTRMSQADHRKVGIVPGDTIIISATPIPGNEKQIGRAHV